MARHPYDPACDCPRCTRESVRRTAQGASDPRRFNRPPARRRQKADSRRPIVGSAEWAETRGDDLGESPDY